MSLDHLFNNPAHKKFSEMFYINKFLFINNVHKYQIATIRFEPI